MAIERWDPFREAQHAARCGEATSPRSSAGSECAADKVTSRTSPGALIALFAC